jgi:hypothetical protein
MVEEVADDVDADSQCLVSQCLVPVEADRVPVMQLT